MSSPPLPTRPRCDTELRRRDLGDEYLFYDREGKRVHVLNAMAREILLLCNGEREPEEIVSRIVERHDVDESQAREDVVRTLRRLAELRIIRDAA